MRKNKEYLLRGDNFQKNKTYKKKWAQKNSLRISKKRAERKNKDINYRLICNLRSRLSAAIKNNYKNGSAIKDSGCTIEELKRHLESKFYPNEKTSSCMSWENYGREGWHIDHVKSLSSFDLAVREQLLEACHYTNLQPLWAEDNLSKGSK